MDRIEDLKHLAFEKKNLDGFLVTNPCNLFYLTGTPGAFCMLVQKHGKSILYSYGVNYEQTKAEAKGPAVELIKRDEVPGAKFAKQAKASKIRKLGLDDMSHSFYRQLAKEMRGQTRLKLQVGLVWELRKVKDEKELELMRKAGKLTVAGMKVASESIRPGVTEIEVAGEIEYAIRKGCGYGTAFETIVASGVRSAYPHGGCADRKIQNGDLVVVDVGAAYEFYRSDMTRTFAAGKPTAKQKRLYEVERLAQQKAYEAIKPKARAKDVDSAARRVIEDAGYGEYFVHGLGHGVGLDIHEPPTLSQTSKDRLAVGNVVTDEPGIYLPGHWGVRIEDTVAVRRRVAEKLTDGFYSLEAEK